MCWRRKWGMQLLVWGQMGGCWGPPGAKGAWGSWRVQLREHFVQSAPSLAVTPLGMLDVAFSDCQTSLGSCILMNK